MARSNGFDSFDEVDEVEGREGSGEVDGGSDPLDDALDPLDTFTESAEFDDEGLRDLGARTRRETSRPAGALGPPGRPRRPGARRRAWAWLALAVAAAGLVVGIAVGHGLAISASLVLAGVAGHLFEPPAGRRPTGT